MKLRDDFNRFVIMDENPGSSRYRNVFGTSGFDFIKT